MPLQSIGDQSHLFLTRRLTGQLRADLQRLTEEISTGRRKNAATPITGDLSQLLSLRRELTGLTAYKAAVTEAQLITGSAQMVLERIGKSASDVSVGLLAAGLTRSSEEIASAAADAKTRFSSAVTALNAQASGLSLFAGIATDQPALAKPELILAALEAALAGQSTAAGVQSTLENWFLAPGGGFATQAFLGNSTPLSYRISPSEDVSLSVTADNMALRHVLLGLAMAVAAPNLAEVGEQAELIGKAGEAMLAAGGAVIELRAGLGAAEARVAQRGTQLGGEISAMKLAEAELIGVDPYDVSVALEASATRLETLYTVTARLARLNLADYLR